ncbi:3-dehydrosphinganine reductase TSC10A-like isoform X1 [Carya illinoinensis]|uniref:3-dehydrosphinganine reductase n=1 Tax=Carya illinoinensis TaxID=32201 RepID=A0A8T1RCV8_CARIL|nr:3-dehydrosphinganine reductase TSC10A-like isoform X1 [Carya illinoinensis]KAG6664449.1 hypothetical protein CIPAW_02G093600 [Carya illinoinensis]KAG6664450.1 hypothetical protein CIPAW_02G093600 [Carya illinoinensis]
MLWSLEYLFEAPSMADPNLAYLSFLLLVPLSILFFLYLIVRPRPVRIPIKNRHVFITGGSSGIGLALAHQAASEGARVSILARSLDKLEDAKQAIRLATGIDVAVFAADVRDYDAVTKAVEEAGPIDVLIVNQGVFVPQELERQGLDEVKFMVDVNLIGAFNMIKAALPAMKLNRSVRGPASIALMSSQAGQVGIYGYTAYSASKFGLRGLAEALQQEVIADDIHVSLIFPPDTDTPGLVEENKRRPQLTAIIAASSGAMKADEVAMKALSGIKSGSFIVPCNFDGLLLSIATAGLSPQRSFLMAFVEVVAIGIIRFVALCYQWNWYRSIEKWTRKNRFKFIELFL